MAWLPRRNASRACLAWPPLPHSHSQGRVPLLKHIPDLIRVQRELGLAIRVHPGLPDEETCAGLAEVGIDGAMVDIIGHRDTISAMSCASTSSLRYFALP